MERAGRDAFPASSRARGSSAVYASAVLLPIRAGVEAAISFNICRGGRSSGKKKYCQNVSSQSLHIERSNLSHIWKALGSTERSSKAHSPSS